MLLKMEGTVLRFYFVKRNIPTFWIITSSKDPQTEYLSSHNTTHYTSITGWRSDGYCCSVITLVLYHIHGEWFTFGRENYQQFCTWHMAALTVAITLSDSRQTLPRQPIRDQTDSDLGSQSDGRQPLGTSALHSEMRRVTKSNWYCTGQQFN